jgi:hypothetical protein
MRSLQISRATRRLIIFCIALSALVIAPLLSSAQPLTSVNIVNNSSGEIRHVYISHVGSDDWSADQLGDAAIAAGQSRTVGNLACDQQQVRVIGEDQNGCFLSTVITCGDSATWTISNDTSRDCGGN